ncbi:S-layer homology domain-containing protein [Intestinimonas butyriciproducens]|uniref:S-layer homology domain-containing protein n=1 Tax=Intestinimonas butyriciproducens TaxID=1297617 RepID=UPI0020A05F3D|nr:S-layer homology domain-containing protein [Intestinimonas butyriciproducens]
MASPHTHTYDQQVATDEYKASDATCTAKATYYKSCICGAKGTETFESGEVNASNHTFGAWIDEVSATCKTTGTKGHKDCIGCNKHFDVAGNEITDLTIPIDPANHTGTLGGWVKTDPDKHWKEYPCCHVKVEEGTHVYDDDTDTTCNTCDYERTITPSHTHSWSTAWSKNDTHHWHECTGEGCDVTENSDKDGYAKHTAGDWIIDKAATSSTSGSKHKECTVCHEVLATETIPATGSSGGVGGSGVSTYAITVESAKNGDVTSSHKSAAKGTTVTLTVEPDKGYTLETITATDASGNKLKLTEKDGKYTFTMPASKVTVKATFMEDNSMLNFFVDVPADAYYYDAVLWAAEEGITGGVDSTHFAPNATCTRAQAVTFLWRAAGSPAPKSSEMPFTDVAAGSYYYDAVLWAVENGITKGTSDTTFTPNAKCTRAQIVTFLWRSQKSPAADSVNPFTDVAADAYYNNAVLWAAENGITGGTSATTFSPNNDCTRAQIVTFLYRALNEQ